MTYDQLHFASSKGFRKKCVPLAPLLAEYEVGGLAVLSPDTDTDELLCRAQAGDAHARGALLLRHRGRLRRMVELRLDGRLAARLDPSDVVQEALAEADRRLDGFLRDRPLPF